MYEDFNSFHVAKSYSFLTSDLKAGKIHLHRSQFSQGQTLKYGMILATNSGDFGNLGKVENDFSNDSKEVT